MARKSKNRRISDEIKRLSSLYEDLPENKKKLAEGLIKRAGFMRVECEDLEEFLKENGWAEAFQQSDKCPPYDRARPQGQSYQTLNTSYQKIIKQLNDMLPVVEEKKPESDGFDEFLSINEQI